MSHMEGKKNIMHSEDIHEINVCVGSSCHVRGAYNIVQAIQQIMEERALHDKIDLKTTFCMKECHNVGVAVSVDGAIHHVAPEAAMQFIDSVVADF